MRWKWNKALNGYFYTKPDNETFYQIEVTKNGAGKIEYNGLIYLKEYSDMSYITQWSRNSLNEVKKIIKKHYKEKLAERSGKSCSL